jgi:hypothetical protein
MSSLHKKADRLSAYVEMLVVNESKVEFGVWMPLTRLRGGHDTGTFAGKTFPGDCDHGPREFHHRIETKNQAVLAAGASKKTQIRLAY